MSQFFIRRPVFAWVIALFIILLGLIAIPELPVARYPSVAPPTVTITATYPGATPQTMTDSVLSLIERELSGVRNLLYFESASDTSGQAKITATFKPGTDSAMAQVEVQNKLKSVEPRLPPVVRQNGVIVESASTGFLLFVGLKSDSGRYDENALADYMARNVVEDLRRVEGVGKVQLFGSEQAMRIWVDPQKLITYGLSMNDLTTAVSQQNVQIAPGSLGAAPALPGQRVTVPLTAQGQLTSPEQFAKIVLRANANGSKVVLGDVARVELGPQSFTFVNSENGKPATFAGVQLAPGANAVKTAEAVREQLDMIAKTMPAGMTYSIPFDTAPFVKISIEKVIHTLIEAMVLVFLVMYLFLQNVRYTLIPAIVAPVAMLGTFTVMLMTGFSINVLTMFGMVLAIGIIVDDAIVVVENVERLMVEEGLSPKDATIKAMKEITGAIIGITLVLTAVFLPMAMSSGSVGVIYQQFTMSMAVSIMFSALLALTLTPAPVRDDAQAGRARPPREARLLRLVQPPLRPHDELVRNARRQAGRPHGPRDAAVRRDLHRAGVRLPHAAVVVPARGRPGLLHDRLPAPVGFDRRAHGRRGQDPRSISRLVRASSRASPSSATASGLGSNAALNYAMLKDWDKREGANAMDEAMRARRPRWAA